jgi:hypothetical protein
MDITGHGNLDMLTDCEVELADCRVKWDHDGTSSLDRDREGQFVVFILRREDEIPRAVSGLCLQGHLAVELIVVVSEFGHAFDHLQIVLGILHLSRSPHSESDHLTNFEFDGMGSVGFVFVRLEELSVHGKSLNVDASAVSCGGGLLLLTNWAAAVNAFGEVQDKVRLSRIAHEVY